MYRQYRLWPRIAAGARPGERFKHERLGHITRGPMKVLDAEPATRIRFVNLVEGMGRPHLRAMTANSGELTRDPIADVHDQTPSDRTAVVVRSCTPTWSRCQYNPSSPNVMTAAGL